MDFLEGAAPEAALAPVLLEQLDELLDVAATTELDELDLLGLAASLSLDHPDPRIGLAALSLLDAVPGLLDLDDLLRRFVSDPELFHTELAEPLTAVLASRLPTDLHALGRLLLRRDLLDGALPDRLDRMLALGAHRGEPEAIVRALAAGVDHEVLAEAIERRWPPGIVRIRLLDAARTTPRPPRTARSVASILSQLRQLEDEAQPAALFLLGHQLFARGDRREARDVLIEAAALGSPEAAHDAAYLLIESAEDREDFEAALRLFEQASVLPQGKLGLGQLLITVPGREAEGCDLLLQAAEEGELEGWYVLGLMHQRGLGGLRQDDETARALHARAGQDGHLDAEFELSLMYRLGIGGDQEVELADALEDDAAFQGHPRACANRGARFARGELGASDLAMAALWYRRAARGGSAEAAARLARMCRDGEGVAQDEEQSRRWFLHAAELGWDWSGGGERPPH